MVTNFILEWIEEEVIQATEAPGVLFKETCWEIYVDGARNAKGVGMGICNF